MQVQDLQPQRRLYSLLPLALEVADEDEGNVNANFFLGLLTFFAVES
jgi:hypothetical protein